MRAGGKAKLTPSKVTNIKSMLRGINVECAFYTRACTRPGQPVITASWHEYETELGELLKPRTMRKHQKWYHTLTEKEHRSITDVPLRSLGKCAIVAFGSNLMKTPRGSEIDQHDTSFRFGLVPLKKYAKYAGSRAGFIYIRTRKLRATKGMFAGVDHNGFKYADLGGGRDAAVKAVGGGDKPIMIYASYVPNGNNGFPNLNYASLSEPSRGAAEKAMDIALGLRPQIRHAGKHDSRPDLTSGFVLLFHLMYSKLCTSIGVFGISESMGPRYWDGAKGRPLTSNHNTALEASIIRALQSLPADILPTPVVYYP